MLAVETAKTLTNECETSCSFPKGTSSAGGSNTNAPLTSATVTPLRLKTQNATKGHDDKPEKFDSTLTIIKGKLPPKPPNEFYKDLYQFHERRGTPIVHTPKISGLEMDLYRLYCEVTERGGFQKVNNRDEWNEIITELGMYEKCVNGTAAIKYIYRRILEKYERQNYFGEDPDKADALDGNDGIELGGRGNRMRYSSSLYNFINISSIHNVPMSYNHRQHVVNMDRRRQFKLSTDIYKPSPYEKLMLSLLSPLPNEQDFAINACTLMTNEPKHTLRLSEYPKLLNALVAHAGVYSDRNMRKLFEHTYNGVRRHSLYAFWRDLLHDRHQILDLYTEEQITYNAALVEESERHSEKYEALQKECMELDFLNLGRDLGTRDYVGQRVLQIVSILRNLSFLEENVPILAKNRTLLRFLVMSSNIRWNNIHIQALEITGNIAIELELLDPSLDDLSRNLMATLCDGIDCSDRSLILNSLEILYKLCQKDGNEEYVLKCLNFNFYQTLVQFLSLSDIMLLIFALEAIYVLTSLGTKSCHIMMQVRGVIDQLISLITVEAQSYGPNGCILMRVIETIPGNMLPTVAQNMPGLQNATNPHSQTSSFPSPQAPILNRNQPNAVAVPASTTPTPPPHPAEVTIDAGNSNPSVESNSSKHTLHNFTNDDEQYALTWLTNTCERSPIMDSHIEQQELFRMYLNHCQKSGKVSVVNHMQFARLVSMAFGSGVGPVMVKPADGTDLPGLQYVAIRLKSTTLPVQNKTNTPTNASATSPKPNDSLVTIQRKLKKKLKPDVVGVLKSEQTPVASVNETNNNIEFPAIKQTKKDIRKSDEKLAANEQADNMEAKLQLSISNKANEGTQTTGEVCTSHTPSALIKSLLANKVNQRQQKQKDLSSSVLVPSNSPSAGNQITVVSMANTPTAGIQPIKVVSTAISALVNNPLMQNASVKVGQTTIKPVNPQSIHLDKKSISESVPPPLAPLSGNNVTKDLTGRPMILSNQMLVDIIDKKFIDTSSSSCPNATVTAHKRKQEGSDSGDCKRPALETNCIEDDQQATPSKNAANLYAEIAASILEDDDLEDIPPITHPPQLIMDQPQPSTASILIPAKIQTQSAGNALQNVQRQLVFQNNSSAQLKLSQPTPVQSTQIPNAMATIKTEQGLQTVPVILQQKHMDSNKPATQIIQQVIQHNNQPQQTQYVLATNQQGQTYLVAQQPAPQPQPPPPPPTQTVLVTQTAHQQTTGAKTIIILQQQSLPSTQQQILTNTAGGGQKVIMTTPQGQQVLVTQRPQTPQQIFINPQTGAATHVQHMPVPVTVNSAQTSLVPRQIMQAPQHQQQITSGQISPSLLNQLNQIPATIKLHQPTPAQQQLPQPSTISRMNKAVSIVPTGNGSVVSPVTIPQLQQHQSIIQQHIITGGSPAEKRHVILGGGRAIEIKETVITSPQPPPHQQCQLNSQTFITRQTPSPAPSPAPTPPLLQQQKISVPLLQVASTPTLIAPKATEPANVYAKAIVPAVNFASTQAVVPSALPSPLNSVANSVTAVKKLTSTAVNTTLVKSNLALVPYTTTTAVSNSGPPPLTISSTASTSNHIQIHKPTLQKDIIKESSSKEEASKTSVFSTSGLTTAATTPTNANDSISQNSPTLPNSSQTAHKSTTAVQQQQQQLSTLDMQWLYICDWRNCPRHKFKSQKDLQHHVYNVHVPEHLDFAAEIFCQWGVGPGLCDGVPRKRFSLMTHLIERHLTYESLRAAAQRRITTGLHNLALTKPPVTIVRNVEVTNQRNNNANAGPTTNNAGGLQQQQNSAMQAIKRRYTSEFLNSNELMDENEGPVTKSIRLTAALILRNLVTNSSIAKRCLRRYESHLANVALSNVESSATISHILYELNN